MRAQTERVQMPAAMMTLLTFPVHRKEPVLVGPAVPTPRVTKRLSDIDDRMDLRNSNVPLLFFYRGRGEAHDTVSRGDDRDPAGVIRRALGDALVSYYPLAGRMREVDGGKLVVDCTGEGIPFVEADADVRLAELEAAGLRAPFPCMDQLLFDVEGSSGALNCPMLLVQVTRLLCGGVVVALRFNHSICDAIGIAQFASAVGELARGLPAPTVAPVWSRELLEARSPPTPSFTHPEYDAVPMPPPPTGEMVLRTFTFTPADVSSIKKKGLPPHLQNTTTSFEVLTAALWRARTVALDTEARLVIVVNVRNQPGLGIPTGYYGNACTTPAVVTTAGALLAGSLGEAVGLVREAKKAATDPEYARSTADVLVLRGRSGVTLANAFLVSDNRHAGFHLVDFGWGELAYGGLADYACFGASQLVTVRNEHGEDATGLLIVLPRPVMDRFASEVEALLKP